MSSGCKRSIPQTIKGATDLRESHFRLQAKIETRSVGVQKKETKLTEKRTGGIFIGRIALIILSWRTLNQSPYRGKGKRGGRCINLSSRLERQVHGGCFEKEGVRAKVEPQGGVFFGKKDGPISRKIEGKETSRTCTKDTKGGISRFNTKGKKGDHGWSNSSTGVLAISA